MARIVSDADITIFRSITDQGSPTTAFAKALHETSTFLEANAGTEQPYGLHIEQIHLRVIGDEAQVVIPRR